MPNVDLIVTAAARDAVLGGTSQHVDQDLFSDWTPLNLSDLAEFLATRGTVQSGGFTLSGSRLPLAHWIMGALTKVGLNLKLVTTIEF